MIGGLLKKNYQWKLRQKAEKDKNLSQGIDLAKKLISEKISVDAFAKKYSSIKEGTLFEGKTGLFSALFFEVELEQEISKAKRSDESLSLMLVDVDRLKSLNDQFGHSFGDKVIKTVGKVIQNTVRAEDTPCRWGGDEFIILLPETDCTEAEIIARRIKSLLSVIRLEFHGKKVDLEVSVGITQHKKGESTTVFFNRVDKAVYMAKTDGRNKIVLN